MYCTFLIVLTWSCNALFCSGYYGFYGQATLTYIVFQWRGNTGMVSCKGYVCIVYCFKYMHGFVVIWFVVVISSVPHYNDVIMSAMASQITRITIVYSIIYSGAYQRKHQSYASLAFVRGIHRGPVNSPHKGPVTRKVFPFDDVIMEWVQGNYLFHVCFTGPGAIVCLYAWMLNTLSTLMPSAKMLGVIKMILTSSLLMINLIFVYYV